MTMKNLLFIAIALITLSACTTDQDELSVNQYTEKWELFNFISNQPNQLTNTISLDYQEYYYLSDDSTFFKRRVSNTTTKNMSGIYNFMSVNDHKYIVFKYDESNNFIGNCSNNLNEVLLYIDDNKIRNTWENCEGPTLEYRKIIE